MQRIFWQIMAFVVCGVALLGFSARAQKEALGGFTPNASVTIAFPKSTYPMGATAQATISIAGSPNKKYEVSVKDDKGTEVGPLELEIGGPPGSNTGTLDIVLPSNADSVTYKASFSIGGKTPENSATLTLKPVREWEATPAIVVGELYARDTNVRPGQAVTISVEASDEDTWTDFDGKTGTDPDTALRYTWDPGNGTIREGQGTASIVWISPKKVAASSLPTQVTCTVDDSLDAGQTGVEKPTTGTRNDNPSEIKSVSIEVSPKPCGDWIHDHWDEASEVQWTEGTGGYPVPFVAQPAKEHARWEDDCSDTTKPAEFKERFYGLIERNEVRESDGSVYLEVVFQALSGYGGPDTALLKGRHSVSKSWTVGNALSGGGQMIVPSAGEQVKAGESVTVVMTPAFDSDTWTRGSYRENVGDDVKYSWTTNVGSFSGTPTGSVANWNAPPVADVPAGAEGLTVTITCSADDRWGEGQTGVSAPDTGTRNDSKGVAASVSFQVLREPCGRWLHKAWGESAALNWKTDGNGDPEPIDPDSISETLRWEDLCAATTKADKTSDVAYQKIKDQAVEDEGVWYREVEYQAFSGAASGDAAPKLSGRRALPRHWTTPGELDGGDLKVTVSGAPDQGETAPTKAGQAVVITIPAGADASASFAISGARDTDTYSYWNVPEKGSDDGLRYKWTLNGGPADGPQIDEINLGSGSSAALPGQPVLLAGSYTVKCEVDDSSSGDESGVAAPDLGNRNDEPATHTVVVQVVATDWEAGQGIGSYPKKDADGKQIEPVEWVEDGQIKSPAPGSETKAVPGEAVELEVNPASDWDAWTREGIGSGIAADEPLTYKWTASGGKFRVKQPDGSFSEADEVSGLKATWIAPAPDEDATPAEGESYTVTCTIDDGAGARVNEPDESGSHDDEALKREVSIEVVPSYWSPEDKGIGFHPTLDENEQPVKPYEWNEDGRITAPIDQTQEDAPEEKVVLPGAEVTATIEAAQDWDTLTTLDGKSIARDETLTYVWSSGGVGHFLVTDENDVTTEAETATGLSVTWVAPDDVEEGTDIALKCTIDDGAGTPIEAPHAGTRDDEALERTVKIRVRGKFVYLTGSAPDFVVYRNPDDPEFTPEPVVSETVSTGTAADSTGGSVPAEDVEGDPPHIQDADVPDANPDDWIPTEEEPTPIEVPEAVEPTISFGIRMEGFQKWKATVSVYAMGEGSSSLETPLASLQVMGDSDEDNADKTKVKWGQLFPDANPSSGLYFYDVIVEGVEEPEQPLAEKSSFGIQDDEDSQETQRLDTEMIVSEVSWRVLEEQQALVAPAELGAQQQTGVASLPAAALTNLGAEDWPLVEITFSLSGVTSSNPKLWLIDPQLEREKALDIEQLPDGRYKALWIAKSDELKKMGQYLLVADGKGNKPVKKAVPALKGANNSITVEDFAFGYDMIAPNGNTPVASAALRRYPDVASYAKFRAFVKITQTIRGANGTHWYSDAPVANAILDRFEWISEYKTGRMPRNVKKVAQAWNGGNANSLNLSITWRQFSNEVIKQRQPGVDRWYGFRAQTAASGWSYNWQVGVGVKWWGARIGYNKKGKRQVWQLPTDRKGQNSKSNLSYPHAQEKLASFYDKPTFPLDPYFNGTHLWWPDPSGGDSSKWKGRIVGQGEIHAPTFDSADTNAPAGQGEFNATIMHYATGFIGTPYGWGGQTYGGQQSRNATDKTVGSGFKYLDWNGLSLGHSRSKSSYGIDCSGFVTEAATLAGVTGISGYQGQGLNASQLKGAGVGVDSFNYLRPGDFVAWRTHVVYVAEAPPLVDGETNDSTVLPTLEAQPDSLGDELGRTRYSSIRTKGYLRNAGAKWRRWEKP